MRRIVILAACLGALLLFSGSAGAACRTTTCDRAGAAPSSCDPSILGMCNPTGKPLAWPNTCVSTSVTAQGSVTSNITADQMRNIVHNAFQQWTSADCGNGEKPNFVVDIFPDVNCTNAAAMTGDAGYKSAGPNYNLWIFRDTDWPPEYVEDGAIAITLTQFSQTTGEIYDSDVELNSQKFNFTTDLSNVDCDLPSVVQHEAGHVLGLAHTDALESSSAVMLPSLDTHIVRRALQPDDILGICSIYPPGQLNPNCDPEPRHGFSTACDFDTGCCSIAPGRTTRHPVSGIALVVGVFLTAAIGRRKKVAELRV